MHSMTVKTSGISIIPNSPECTIYTRPKVLSGHLKITIHFSYKHALSHLLSYHVKYDERTKYRVSFDMYTVTSFCHLNVIMAQISMWCKQGISLDRLAIHLTINTAPS